MITRRQALRTLAVLSLAPACEPGAPRRRPGPVVRSPAPARSSSTARPIIRVNDTCSRINSTEVAELVDVKTLGDMHATIVRAGREGHPISVSGGGHSSGGQQFVTGALHVDMLSVNRTLGIDRRGATAKIAAGLEWPELVDWLAARQRDGSLPRWEIRQKQVGVDRVTLGGSLAANAHGRGVGLAPIAALARGGRPLLPYHGWSTTEQLVRGYPKLPAFLREKRRFDPGERFRSEWYGSIRSLAEV